MAEKEAAGLVELCTFWKLVEVWGEEWWRWFVDLICSPWIAGLW